MRLSQVSLNPELAARAESLAARLLRGPGGVAPPDGAPYARPWGVIGAGIHIAEQRILLSLEPGITRERALLPAREFPPVADLLRQIAYADEDWSDVLAWSGRDLEQQVKTGDSIVGGGPGTAGAPVQWSLPGGAISYGVLTAGHVAGGACAVILRGTSKSIGSVSAGGCLQPSATSGVDAAIIELSGPAGSSSFKSASRQTSKVAIDIHAPNGTARDDVVSMHAWFYSKRLGATYVDLYETNKLITSGGDSGSAATLVNSGELVGMLIGGGAGSFVQDAQTQIAALRALATSGGGPLFPNLAY